uniref:RNA-directed DNA polymerase n=1 Tax=Rhipicephalus microplus TaxID=6941 RepID=A0A6G5AAB8_RHIMP
MAVRYFRPYLDDRSFKLFTDHQALTYILNLAEPRGKISRWVSELQQFTFMVHHRPGEHLKDADVLSRLAVIDHKNVNATLLWEGTEELKYHNGKFTVPETMVPRILELYHDFLQSGGHDGFWRTYHKIRQRF